MGVIYKLKPQVKEQIVTLKKSNPNISCRGLSVAIFEKFHIKVSKSSINSLFKEAGLSLPVGRRSIKKKLEFKVEDKVQVEAKVKDEGEVEGLGLVLLKAMDYLLAGSYHLAERFKKSLPPETTNILAKTEALLYLYAAKLYQKSQLTCDISLLTGSEQGLSEEESQVFLNNLKQDKGLYSDMLEIITDSCWQVRCMKVNLADGSVFYLDGQMHTVWSSQYLPHDFSATLNNVKGYINKYFIENKPVILFSNPGSDTPTREFFDFILSADSGEKSVSRLTLYGNKLEEIGAIRAVQPQRRFFILGLWPGQFSRFCKISIPDEFKPVYLEGLRKNFYVSSGEVTLSQPETKQKITRRGCAIKEGLGGQVKIIVLTNMPQEEISDEELMRVYLSRWPNLEEGFQDFNRKVELFTYTAAVSQASFDMPDLVKEAPENIDTLFKYYSGSLDLYLKQSFFPPGYAENDLFAVAERFYGLKAKIIAEKKLIRIVFCLPDRYAFLEDLNYMCRRMNEREILTSTGKKLWFSVQIVE